MKIVAIGGSNTLLKGGYLSSLAELMPAATIVNRGIGATNCAMGLYRLMTCDALAKGDVVLWEYALNDSLDRRVRDERYHLKIIEHTIRHVARKGAYILPLIFAHHVDDKAVVPTPYRAMLHHLCAAYGLTVIDIPTEARTVFKVPHLPSSDFRDKSHYLPNGRVVRYAARRIMETLAADLRAPLDTPGIYVDDKLVPVVRDRFAGPEKRNFTNSIIDVDYHDLRDGGATFQPEFAGGRILAGITLISPRAGRCAVTTPSRSMTMMMAPQPAHIDMVLLKAIFGGGWTANIPTDAGSFIHFEQPQADMGDLANPRGILAIVTEEPAATAANP